MDLHNKNDYLKQSNNLPIMKTIYIALLLPIFFCLTACFQQENDKRAQESDSPKTSISLVLYPIANQWDVRYSITVDNDSLIAKNHDSGKDYVKQLSENQINEIDSLASAIKMRYIHKLETWDAWGVQLTINGKIAYDAYPFSFELPPDEVKNLINYLISLSAIKIELYDLSNTKNSASAKMQ